MAVREQKHQGSPTINEVSELAKEDAVALLRAEASYGDSWRKRGGVGAYMMLARKWDRLELQVEQHGYDVFKAIAEDPRQEGIIDDIRDLRRYLFLVEAWCQLNGEILSHEINREPIDPTEDT
jgi:hypothetical protein